MQQNSSFKKKPKKPVKPKKPKVPVVPSTPTIIDTPVSTNPSGFNEKDDPLIAFVNASTLLSDQEVEIIQKACQKQVDEDYGPIWHLGMNSVFVPKGQSAPHGSWQIFFLDNPTISGALGYHDFQMGVPLAYVFISTSQKAGITPSSVASHEVLEMLSDPLINITAQVGSQTFYAYESCDAVQQSAYTVSVNIDGVSYPVKVSNFVTPDWFRTETNGPWDFLGKLSGPLELLPNGSYIGMWTPKTGWVQKNAFGEVKPISEDDMRYLGEGEKATVVMHSSSEPQRCLRPFQRRQMDKPFEVTSSWKMIAVDAEKIKLPEGWSFSVGYGDAVPGGYNERIHIINDKEETVGYIDGLTEYDNPIGIIGIVKINPQHRRKGLATALFHELVSRNPGKKWSAGLATEEGTKWWNSLNHPNQNISKRLTSSMKKTIAMPADRDFLKDVTFKLEKQNMYGEEFHVLKAYHPHRANGEHIGEINWSPETDEVGLITVNPIYRRRGLATALWNKARELNPSITHSDRLFEEGDAWIQSLDDENTKFWREEQERLNDMYFDDKYPEGTYGFSQTIDTTQDKADNGELIIRTPAPSKIIQWMQHSAYPGGTTRMQHPTSGQDRMNINQLVT